MSETHNRLRAARIDVGMSQRDVAMVTGLDQGAISRLERGRRRVTAEELATFAKIYGVTTDWLVCRSESGGPTQPSAEAA